MVNKKLTYINGSLSSKKRSPCRFFYFFEREFVQQEQDLQQQITQQHSQNEQLNGQLSKEREQRLQLESELSATTRATTFDHFF